MSSSVSPSKGLQQSAGTVRIRCEWARGIARLDSPESMTFELSPEADAADLMDLVGPRCRVLRNGKPMVGGTLRDHGIGAPLAHDKAEDRASEIKRSAEEDKTRGCREYVVTCSLLLGGAPHISDYVKHVHILTREGKHALTRNICERRHRTAAELCTEVATDSARPRMLYSVAHTHDESAELAASYKICIELSYEPGGYRMDYDTLKSRNVSVFDTEAKQNVEVDLKGDFPNASCNVPHTFVVSFHPRQRLKRGVVYLLCINDAARQGSDSLPAGVAEPATVAAANATATAAETAATATPIQIMNPYYPVGVADASEAFSSFYRSALTGSLVYSFRLN